MDEELEYFCEDAKDQLGFMEQALMDVVENGVDDEAIGAIFRAMHTIKGTAGMFDFDAIVSFTHIAENLLDSVRQKKITLTEEMLELLLAVKDHVETLIASAIAKTPLTQEILDHDALLRNSLLEALSVPSTQSSDSTITPSITPHEEEKEGVWHLSLRLKKEFFKTGMDLLSIFEFFGSMGEIITILPITQSIPTLEELKPLHPYIGFEIFFLSSASKIEIEEIFEFVEEDIDLIILSSDDSNALKQLIQQRPEIAAVLHEASLYDQTLHSENVQPIIESPIIAPPVIKAPAVSTLISPPIENNEEAIKHLAPKSTFLRVDFQKIDLLINQVSEMVIANAKIAKLAEKYDDTDLEETTTSLGEMLDVLRDGIMNIRMVQVEESFAKLRRNVSDVAKKVGKSIDFSISGGETELDKSVVEKLSDPLVHMLRNSIDHGIENKEDRLAAGKPEHGRIELRAYPESGNIIIEIEDDGRGLNTQVILNKARAKGLIAQNETPSQDDINMMIFHPGFSTAEVVSDISGRGVGMDVVKQNIDALKGRIDIISQLGKGCKFIITLPLTLAIIDGFLVQAGSTKYIIPQDMIQEVVELTENYRVNVGNSLLLNLRGELLPLLDIKDYFCDNDAELYPRENVIIVRYGSYRAGLIVDELFGEQQTVVKSMGALFRKVPGISGGSILGSGEISLIFDIPALINYVIHHEKR